LAIVLSLTTQSNNTHMTICGYRGNVNGHGQIAG
jgi:hypothetical protein